MIDTQNRFSRTAADSSHVGTTSVERFKKNQFNNDPYNNGALLKPDSRNSKNSAVSSQSFGLGSQGANKKSRSMTHLS